MAIVKSKILVIAATGYLGKFMVKASVSMGHPTYVYIRPVKPTSDPAKLELIKEFESMGVTIFQGELDEHEKLVSVLEQVEVVISTLAVPQHLEQFKLIDAIKAAGNIKRFVPSEYGNDVDRVSGLPSFEALLDNKRKVRRATEAAGIPFTYVSANSFAAYFVDYLLHPYENTDEITVYGTGEAKGSPWVVLSRPFLEFCVFGWDNLPRTILMYVNTAILSQEIYFHSVICNSHEFKNTTINGDLRHMVWDDPPKMEPHVLNTSNYEGMVQSGVFARQFAEDDPVLDMVDRNILNRRSNRPTPGAWCTGRKKWLTDPCSQWGDVNVLKSGPHARKLKENLSKLLEEWKSQSNQCI